MHEHRALPPVQREQRPRQLPGGPTLTSWLFLPHVGQYLPELL